MKAISQWNSIKHLNGNQGAKAEILRVKEGETEIGGVTLNTAPECHIDYV